MTQPAGTEDPAAQAAAQQQPEAPPWGEDFDSEKAWKLVQGLRADKEKLASRPVLDDDAKAKLAKFDELQAANQTELEKAQGELTRWQTEAEKWRTTSVSSTVKALAAADFADPDDAVRNIDVGKYLDAGGTIDEKAIAADLAALLDAKPHYRRAESTPSPRAPKPNPSQGSGVDGRPASDPAQQFAAILRSQQ